MTVPVYVLGAISLATQVYFSDRMRKRAVIIVACCVPVAIGYLMPVWSKNPDVGYAGMFVLVVGESLADPESLPLIALTVLPRPLPDLHSSCYMDHNQPGTRHETCHRPAVRVQSGQPVESHFWSAIPEQPRPAICPG
jgi:hypothetical protein